MKTSLYTALAAAFLLASGPVHSGACTEAVLLPKGEIPSTCGAMVMTMAHDRSDRPYLYVANKEAGLKIYHVADPAAPALAATVPITAFESLDVMSLSQAGNRVFLALGNHFTNPMKAGMAIVDVADPSSPVLLDYHVVPGSSSGAGVVKVEDGYAYLGAMKSGLVILDVSDPKDIKQVSQFMPDIDWPAKNPNANFYNARGLEVRQGKVYLAFDAGGLRIIDAQDRAKPREIGRFANPALHIPINLPRAYNNLVLDGTRAYVAVDYCGMEILDVSDAASISLTGWWNPQGCPENNWFTSPIHANEIQYSPGCKRLFISTGKNDLDMVDVSDPAKPASCGWFGGPANNRGTWGVSLWKERIYLSYVCTMGIPFASDWTGVKILVQDAQCTVGIRPTWDSRRVRAYGPELQGRAGLAVFDLEGRKVDPEAVSLPTGIYLGRDGNQGP